VVPSEGRWSNAGATFGDSLRVRRHTPPGLAVVVILILAACAAAGWAAVRDSDPPPVDTQGGIAGRIASGCGQDIAALERASSERIAAMRVTAGDDLDTLLDADERAADTYEDLVDRCLTSIEDWDVATRALATALAGPAKAAGIGRVTVSCDEPIEHAPLSGHVDYYEGRVIHLSAATCFSLERLLARPADLDCAADTNTDYPACPIGALDAADAVVTLAHEEQHTDGIENEAKAECYGLQRSARAAVAMGVAPATADHLAGLVSYWLEVPPEYHSEQCHSGGGLDLQLPSPDVWSYT
jgi:hypothetical protein